MKVLAWVFVGAVGAGATYVSCTTDQDQLAIVAGLVGLFSWAVFAYSSLSITVYDGGTAHTTRYPMLAAYGLLMATPNLYVALTGPLELVRNRDQLKEEIQR